jgi:hypothetical protein
MKNVCAALLGVCLGFSVHAQGPEDIGALGARLDAELFDSYNACELERFGRSLAQDVEFYHDKGGLMVGRQPVVDAVKQNICNKVRRELIPGSLVSYPMANYGLVQLGQHRFCTVGTNKCTGTGRFVHLWRLTGGVWEATRIISYDHQPL